MFFSTCLSLGIADPQKLNWRLEEFTAKLVHQRSTGKIVSTDGFHWGLLDVQEGQDLPVNKHTNQINQHSVQRAMLAAS